MVELDNEAEGLITLRTRAVQSSAGGSLWTSCMGRAGGSGAPDSRVISTGGYLILGIEEHSSVVGFEVEDSPPSLFLFFPRRALLDQVFSPARMKNSMGCGTSSPGAWGRDGFSFAFDSSIKLCAITSRTSRPATFKRISFNALVKSCTSTLGRHAWVEGRGGDGNT